MLEPLSETDVGRKFGGTPSVVPACTLDDAVTVIVLGASEPIIDIDVDGGGECRCRARGRGAGVGRSC